MSSLAGLTELLLAMLKAVSILPLGPAEMTKQASLLEDAHTYHAPIEAMAETAQQAGVKQLVVSHMMPPVPVEQEAQFVAGLDRVFEAKITVGRDLMRIALG